MHRIAFLLILSSLLVSIDAQNFTVLAGSRGPNDTRWDILKFFPEVLIIEQGDTVTFVAAGKSPHTATFGFRVNPGFLTPAFVFNNLTTPAQLGAAPLTSSAVQFSTGLISQPFTVTFDAPVGTLFTYFDVFHPFQQGIILVSTVRDNATAVGAAVQDQLSFIRSRLELQEITKALLNTVPSSRLADNGVNVIWTVRMVGEASPVIQSANLAFTPANITINVGDTVEFVNDANLDHIVAFNTTLETIPPFIVGGAVNPLLRNATNASDFSGGFATSGLLQPAYAVAPYDGLGVKQPSAWNITFTSAGTFPFNCPIHFSLGMFGSVTVTPSNETAAGSETSAGESSASAVETSGGSSAGGTAASSGGGTSTSGSGGFYSSA